MSSKYSHSDLATWPRKFVGTFFAKAITSRYYNTHAPVIRHEHRYRLCEAWLAGIVSYPMSWHVFFVSWPIYPSRVNNYSLSYWELGSTQLQTITWPNKNPKLQIMYSYEGIRDGTTGHHTVSDIKRAWKGGNRVHQLTSLCWCRLGA